MHYLLTLALAAMMIATGISVATSRSIEDAEAVKLAAAQAGVGQAFVLASKMYVAANTYTAGGANDLAWSNLKTTEGLPVGAAAANVPSPWRLRRASATSWVVCATVMSELSMQNVLGKKDLMPTEGNALISLAGTTQQFVLGVQDANTKAALITRCA